MRYDNNICIGYSAMILAAQDDQPHDFKFVAKGDSKRAGGYIATMKKAVVSSSNYFGSSFNLRSTKSGQIRKIYTILIIEFDGKRVEY